MNSRTLLIGLGLASIILCGIGIHWGSSTYSLWSEPSALKTAIIWNTRVPRVLLAYLVGLSLSQAGVAYQAILRNPLADPYILGVSGGAALGAATGTALQMPFAGVMAIAFISSLFSLFVILKVSGRSALQFTHSILLTGVVFNAFAFALILLLHSVLPIQQSHSILFLLMGHISLATPTMVALLAIPMAAGSWMLWRAAPALDALSLGPTTAHSVGIDPARQQRLIFTAGSLLVASAVAATGLIGFIGLFVPHAARLLLGQRHRQLLPVSALLGGCVLVIADLATRTMSAPFGHQTELPVGAITALIGAPCFAWLLRQRMHRSSTC